MDKHNDSLNRTPWVQSGVYRAVTYIGEKVVPNFVTTKHLTYMTLVWATMILTLHADWPYVLPLSIIAWILTDSWDGHMGKLRNEGYVKWGYFADHAFDYLILVSIVLAMFNLFPSETDKSAIVCIGVLCVFNMILSFLAINENGMDLTVCFSDKVYSCFSNTDGLVVLIVALFVGIDPVEKRIRTYPGLLQGLCVAFTLLTVVRFYNIQRRLSDEDEGASKAAKK